MGSWIDQDKAIEGFHDQNMAGQGTGSSLAGQHAVTQPERDDLNHDRSTYQYNIARILQANGGTRTASTEMVDAFRIGQASHPAHFKPEDKEAYLQAAQKAPLGDVNDPAARMKAMSFISQDVAGQAGDKDMDGGVDKSTCAGASIVGAAFLAEGPEGLKAVMKAIEKQDPQGLHTGAKNSPEYKALKEKLAKDPQSLTVSDIQLLQQTTYHVLESKQARGMGLGQNDEKPSGIKDSEMDDFMKKSPELASMFKKNGMEIQFIDNDGNIDPNHIGDPEKETAAEHYVVRMTGKDGKQAIYDPNARRGGQIIDFDDGVKAYNGATKDTIGDDVKPYLNR
jgi:hypothetical protein